MISKLINGYLFYWCEACGWSHSVPVNAKGGNVKNSWNMKGTEECPTLSPSVRHYYTHPETKQMITICHYHIKNGNIEYCGDCPHKFAGKTVPLKPIPEDYRLPEAT